MAMAWDGFDGAKLFFALCFQFRARFSKGLPVERNGFERVSLFSPSPFPS